MIKLKKPALKTSLILALTLALPSGMAYAADTPVSHVEASNTVTYPYTTGNVKIAATSSIAYMGAIWNPYTSRWHFDFRFGGTGTSRNTTSQGTIGNRIEIARMEIKNTINPGNMALDAYTDPAFIGSAPETQGSTSSSYLTVAWAVLNYASLLLTPIQGFLYNTASLANALHNVADSDTTLAGTLTRQWNWSTSIADTGQFFWFSVDAKANTTSRFSSEYMLLGTGYELLSAGKKTYDVNAGAAGSSSSSNLARSATDEDWTPADMTDEEKAASGIIEIPRISIDTEAIKLNIPPSVVKTLKASDDQVFYYAKNFEVTETTSPTNEELTPKEKLIQHINDQAERNELIIDSYQRYDTKNAEQEQIITDHKKQKIILEKLLQRANQVEENNLKGISEIESSLSNLK